jgi:hypothetical protein
MNVFGKFSYKDLAVGSDWEVKHLIGRTEERVSDFEVEERGR